MEARRLSENGRNKKLNDCGEKANVTPVASAPNSPSDSEVSGMGVVRGDILHHMTMGCSDNYNMIQVKINIITVNKCACVHIPEQ